MLITLEAARAANFGKNLAEVVQVCKRIRDKISFIFVADDLYYLAKGGRIHRARPWAGPTISNTVLLEMDMSTGGQNTPLARCRTKGEALKMLFDLIEQRAGNKVIHVAIDHADAPAEAEELKDKVSARFKCAEVYINQMLPVITTHTGVGSRIISWWSED
jgi:DegV family protein with EDD domain